MARTGINTMKDETKAENNAGGFEEGSDKTASASIPPAPGTAVALRGNTASSDVEKALVEMGFSQARSVQLPVLVLKTAGAAAALWFREPMRLSDFAKPGEKHATCCPVADVTTGEESMFLVPATVSDTLRREYPKVSADGVVLVPPAFKADRDPQDDEKIIKSVREKEIEWLDAQPGTWGYVGRFFYIKNEGQRAGKRYKDFTIKEITPPAKKEPA